MSTKTATIWKSKKTNTYLAKDPTTNKCGVTKNIDDASVILKFHIPVEMRHLFEPLKVIITRSVKPVK